MTTPGDTDRGSAAGTWRALRGAVAAEARLGAWAGRRRWSAFLYEFVRFGVKQAWACLFGGMLLLLLLVTARWYPANAPVARYDALTVAAVLLQVGLLATGLETWREAKVIVVFHVAGTVMELFKTSVGSWAYPEAGLLRIGGVPLFTGFLYAAVGSYLARAWRVFDLRFRGHPGLGWLSALAAAVYVNFFTHHALPDVRVVLFVWSAVLFRRTWVFYRVFRVYRSMPMLLGLGLVAVFIWFAENIGTFAHAWVYPHQMRGWAPVGPGKLGAWFLLMLISYTLVALENRPRRMARGLLASVDNAAVRSRLPLPEPLP